MTDIDELALIREAVIECDRCALRAQARQPVPFSGAIPTTNGIAIVAEAPGKTEDEQGVPLVGRAGELLKDELTRIGVEWEATSKINTCSCFPGELKTPRDEHITACEGLKLAQLDLAAPKWVLLVGKVALSGFRTDLTLGQARGRPFRLESAGPVFFTTYHPSAGLRKFAYLQAMRDDLLVFKDMVAAGVNEWTHFVNERCAVCGEQFLALDHTGIPFCEDDVPQELEAYKQMLLAHGLRLIDKHFPGTTVEPSTSS